MPSGKRTWSEADTLLYWCEQCISRMRIALNADGHTTSFASIDSEPPRVSLPESSWKKITDQIVTLAEMSGLVVRFDRQFWNAGDAVVVTFKKQKGT